MTEEKEKPVADTTDLKGKTLDELTAIAIDSVATPALQAEARLEIKNRLFQVLLQIDEYLLIVRSTKDNKTALFYAQQAHALAFTLQSKFPHIFGEPGKVSSDWTQVFGIDTPVGGILIGMEPKVGKVPVTK